jgi:RNA polymerase sigma-B factor
VSQARERVDPAALLSVEQLLARYARTGDRRDRERAFEQSMPLARRLAWRHRRGQEPVDDLLQVAYVGLVGAIDRFDPARGTRFASFAGPTITGELLRYFRNTSWTAHVPRGVQEHLLVVRRAIDDLTTTLGRCPSVSELEHETGLDTEQITEALHAHAALHASSLDSLREDDGDGLALIDVLGDDDEHFEQVDRRAAMTSLFHELPRSDRDLLSMRFEDDLTQSEIAARLGCSQMQVSRLLRRLLAQLAHADGPASAHRHALA